MKEITISSKKYGIKIALVDDCDFEWLSKFTWHFKVSGYATMNYGGTLRKQIAMHRVILGISDSAIQVDHKDHNKLNNCRGNLRVCTGKQNGANRSPRKGSTSNYLGVSWFKRDKKWICHIKKDGKSKHLGVFNDENEAARAYDSAARSIHGEFANLNFK
jgi:hypothetical protein